MSVEVDKAKYSVSFTISSKWISTKIQIILLPDYKTNISVFFVHVHDRISVGIKKTVMNTSHRERNGNYTD